MDMNPLTTPQTCMSDAVNATLVTFNGNEFTLQSDNGNVQIPGSQIKEGYVPVGMTEYGGIIYVALLNPETNDCEIGSIPSPDFDVSPKGANKDGIEVYKANDFCNNPKIDLYLDKERFKIEYFIWKLYEF